MAKSEHLSDPVIVVLWAVSGFVLTIWAQTPGPGEPPVQGTGMASWGVAAGALFGFVLTVRKRPWKNCPRIAKHSVDRKGKVFGDRPECWICGGHNRYPRIPTRVGMVFGWTPRGKPRS